MSSPVELFGLATRGVNVVEAPTHLSVEEVTAAQNVEVVSDAGENALDQRPGMSKVNAVALGGTVVMAQDVPADALLTRTPTLYAGMYTGSTHNWRKSTDGTTWTDADTPAKPVSNNTNIAFYNESPKCVTVAGRMYFYDGASPIALHSFDGVTDATVATVPPAVSGAVLTAPGIYPGDPNGFGIALNGTPASTTYSYKFVAVQGPSHSAVSAVATYTTGPVTLSGVNYLVLSAGTPPAGATTVDVYRTVGGATQGKIGTIPIVSGAYTLNNGSNASPGFQFTDAGLVGDGTTAPSTASGATAGNAIGILDMITDGTSIYLATIDGRPGDPVIYGRILQFFPATGAWVQIGASFPTASGNGTAAALALYDGALTYGTYIGAASGNTSYAASTGTPLPAGGIPEVHTTGANTATVGLAAFNGDLYSAYQCPLAGTPTAVGRRTPGGTWLFPLISPSTGVWNSFSAPYVFNGRLFVGNNSGVAGTGGGIYSTLDGVTWTLEQATTGNQFVTQMVTFQGNLYIVLGRTGAAFNTSSSILKRTPAGVYSTADDPADDFAGCIGVVYV